MSKADIVFSLIAKAVGMERQAAELRALMDLYVDAVDEDMAELDVPEVPVQVQEPEVAGANMPVSMPETPDRQTGERDGYTGFLHLQCPKCGRTKTFYTKQIIQSFRCGCGEVFRLERLVKAWTRCECGRRSSYFTNCTKMRIAVPCVACGKAALAERRGDGNYKPIWVHQEKGADV